MVESNVLTAPDRTELLEGTIFERPPANHGHDLQVEHLHDVFVDATDRKTLISVENPVVLGKDSSPRPDLALLRSRRSLDGRVAPKADEVLLIVEVVEFAHHFHFNRKLPLYAEHGIDQIWLVDLSSRTLVAHRYPERDRYRRHERYEGYATVQLERPSVQLRVGELFAPTIADHSEAREMGMRGER